MFTCFFFIDIFYFNRTSTRSLPEENLLISGPFSSKIYRSSTACLSVRFIHCEDYFLKTPVTVYPNSAKLSSDSSYIQTTDGLTTSVERRQKLEKKFGQIANYLTCGRTRWTRNNKKLRISSRRIFATPPPVSCPSISPRPVTLNILRIHFFPLGFT